MNLKTLIERIRNNDTVLFSDTMEIINNNYIYHESEFSNGVDNKVINKAGENEGSCKTFAFAKLHNFSQQQTLELFGEHYRGVLLDPDGISHQNIRQFIKYGWEAVEFQREASDILKIKL